MAGAAFEVTFDDAQIMAALDRVEASVAESGGLLAQLGQYGVSSTLRRFEIQAGPDGTPWAGLSPAYAMIKDAMEGGGKNILYAFGDFLQTASNNPWPI